VPGDQVTGSATTKGGTIKGGRAVTSHRTQAA
jgi:hypothetical protein